MVGLKSVKSGDSIWAGLACGILKTCPGFHILTSVKSFTPGGPLWDIENHAHPALFGDLRMA